MYFTPGYVGGRPASEYDPLSWREFISKTLPLAALIVIVLGGIYTGWLTPVEAGAAGAALGLLIALLRRRMTAATFWQTLLETGHITAAILFLITTASIYSRMLGLAGFPNELADIIAHNELSFHASLCPANAISGHTA